MGKVKKITKRRKKEILSKESSEMTVFEVLKTIPVGNTDLSSILHCSALFRSIASPPYSLRTMDLYFHKQLADRERLLFSSIIRQICERGLLAADLIENGLVEK